MNYLFHIGVYLGVYSILALSLNLVVGYCGLLTLAHASYFAIGCYAYALATIKLGWGFLPATALGAALAALMSLLLSIPAWRFKGDSFVLISLCVQTFVFGLVQNWSSPAMELGTWANLTNGPLGIAGVPKPAILGIKLDTTGSLCALSLLLAVLFALAMWLLAKSPWGRMLKAMRDDEVALRGLGKNVRVAKIQALAIACAMAAVAGATYSSYMSYVDPSAAGLDESILMLSMVLVGGVGNFRGPLVGALLLLGIPELLRLLVIPSDSAANVRLMAYGLLLILMMQVRPQGIGGTYRVQ